MWNLERPFTVYRRYTNVGLGIFVSCSNMVTLTLLTKALCLACLCLLSIDDEMATHKRAPLLLYLYTLIVKYKLFTGMWATLQLLDPRGHFGTAFYISIGSGRN